MIKNETILSVMSQHKCLSFSIQPVTKEDLDVVLNAGKINAFLNLNCNFTVIQSPEGFKSAVPALGAHPPSGFPPAVKWPDDILRPDAPILILISGNENTDTDHFPYYMMTCCMMFAASSIGLATAWNPAFVKDSFRDEASCSVKPHLIPEHHKIFSAFYLGHPLYKPDTPISKLEATIRYL